MPRRPSNKRPSAPKKRAGSKPKKNASAAGNRKGLAKTVQKMTGKASGTGRVKKLPAKKQPAKKQQTGRRAADRRARTPVASQRKTAAAKISAGLPRQKRPAAGRQAGRQAAGRQTRAPSTAHARRRNPTRGARKTAGVPLFLRQLTGLLLVMVITGVLALYYYSQSLPPLHAAGIHRPPVVMIVDKDGAEISREYGTRGESVRLAELPPHVIQAFIATEDKNFYHHLGVNPLAIARAGFANMRGGGVIQGGSTITQQLAKNEYLTSARTLKRKIQELLIALWLETRYSKDEILTYYLDTVYFGAGATGLDAAAERYFRKKPYDLTIGEAAMLAGLLKAPSKYAPTHNIKAARGRAKIVLNAMVRAGYLRPAAAQQIAAAGIAGVSGKTPSGHYAIDYTMEEYIRLFGPPKSDVTIITTLDLAAQTELEKRAPALLAADTRVPAQAQLALVATEHYGAIRVLIGGKDYRQSHFNRASKARRQPGSAFKPFVFLAGIENGFYPDDLVLDQPTRIDGWQPANYKDTYYGTIAAQDALAKSLNAATLYIQESVGREKVRDIARYAGFDGKLAPGAALGLGVNEVTPLELAGAYGFFANDGWAVQPFIIDMVKSAEGRILFQRDILAHTQKTRKVNEKSVIALNHMLRRVITHGSGARARLLPHHAAGKTGTSQNSRDAWFAGHASGLVGVVWIGRDDNKPMSGPNGDVSGAGIPAVIWREMMKTTLHARTPRAYTPYRPAKRLPNFMRPFESLFGRKERGPDTADPDRARPDTADPDRARPDTADLGTADLGTADLGTADQSRVPPLSPVPHDRAHSTAASTPASNAAQMPPRRMPVENASPADGTTAPNSMADLLDRVEGLSDSDLQSTSGR